MPPIIAQINTTAPIVQPIITPKATLSELPYGYAGIFVISTNYYL